MPKLVTLTLTKVKYSGKAIGNDITIEIKYKDSVLRIKKKIKNGTEVQLSDQIFEEWVSESLFHPILKMKVIEDDGIFDDEGYKDAEIKVDINKETPQVSMHDIEVHERRSRSPGQSKAIFSVTVEATVSSYFYVTPESDGGWISALQIGTSVPIPLSECLKVRLDSEKDNRYYFTIEEGRLQGTKASVKVSDGGVPFLTPKNEQTGAALLVYSMSKKTLTWGQEVFKAEDNSAFPWKIGTYKVEIPDAPHKKARGYLTRAKYALVWFPIEFEDQDRYLHPGSVSLGCVTIIELKKWDSFCKKLMRARLGDSKHVGTLQVIQ